MKKNLIKHVVSIIIGYFFLVCIAFAGNSIIDCGGLDKINFLKNGDFESYNLSTGTYSLPVVSSGINYDFWAREGWAGLDVKKGYSYQGANNAWIRNNQGWNAIRQTVMIPPGIQVFAGKKFRVSGMLKTSNNFRMGYFGIKNTRQQVINETRFWSNPEYKWFYADFIYTGQPINVFVGFWSAPGEDTWVQIDNIKLNFVECAAYNF